MTNFVPFKGVGTSRINNVAAKPADRAPSGLLQAVTSRFAGVVPQANYRVQQLGYPGVFGLALLAFSAATYIGTVAPLQEQNRLDLLAIDQAIIAAESNTSKPVPAASVNAAEFIDTLPDRDALPLIVAEIAAAADDAGVELLSGDYVLTSGSTGEGIDRYQLDLPVSGSYVQVREFVDQALIVVPTMALETFTIERENVSAVQVDANLGFAVMVREER